MIAEMNRDYRSALFQTLSGLPPERRPAGIVPVIHDFVHRADLSPLICFVRWNDLFEFRSKTVGGLAPCLS